MKKNYTTPNAEVISVELETMIAASNNSKKRTMPSRYEDEEYEDEEDASTGFYSNAW